MKSGNDSGIPSTIPSNSVQFDGRIQTIPSSSSSPSSTTPSSPSSSPGKHIELKDLQIQSQEEIDRKKDNAFANLAVLKLTALSFFIFVVAEMVGAVWGNSLSLLGDASAMSLDVSSYVISIIVEEFKLRNNNERYPSNLMS